MASTHLITKQLRYYLAATESKYTFSSLKKVLLKSEAITRIDIWYTNPLVVPPTRQLSGLFDLTATTKETTCKLDKQKLDGVVSISQLNDKVTVRFAVFGDFFRESGRIDVHTSNAENKTFLPYNRHNY